MLNILVVYAYTEYGMRASSWDHLYCFQRYANHQCFYINLWVSPIPFFFQRIKFDLIIFHTMFTCQRWTLPDFKKVVRRAEVLKNFDAVKVALPQDEFLQTDVLCDFINDFQLDCVFSVSPQSEWKKIYPHVDFQKTRFYTILTGYLDEKTIKKITKLEKTIIKRPIDIGYRAWQVDPWLGRHGMLKAKITKIFDEEGPKYNLATDVSIRTEDAFYGDDWYRFLLRCKYTIGVEGGASILDFNGEIRKKTNQFLLNNPNASFDEVEQACFPDIDGHLKLFALSPRHLEACATHTCQVLMEGNYNGVLIPNEHYIELKADFSNLSEVLELIRSDTLRDQITHQAYKDIVLSGCYTYQSFVNWLITESISYQNHSPHHVSFLLQNGKNKPVKLDAILYRLNLAIDYLSWYYLFIISLPRRIIKKIVAYLLPSHIIIQLRRIKHLLS